MIRSIGIVLLFLCCMNAQSQTNFCKNVNAGIELDVWPYITGGYFAAGWIGKDHIRGRMLMAHVNKPDVFVKDGFTN